MNRERMMKNVAEIFSRGAVEKDLPAWVNMRHAWKARLLDETSVPSPISMALTAPIDMMALARHASSFSKTGSPMPAGNPWTIHSTLDPIESFSAIQSERRTDAFS